MPGLPRIFRPTPNNMARLASKLRNGDLVGVPSETVYGLAANALDPVACKKIFKAKGRPVTDPLIVHLASVRDLENVAISNPTAVVLAKAFWPGPLTLVLPKKSNVPDLITAGKQTVAVRIPRHGLFRKLIRLSGCPLAAPSANKFGYISPTRASHVRDGFTEMELTTVLDGGECTVGVESTIIDLSGEQPSLLRPGGIPVQEIESILKRVVLKPSEAHRVIAPGVAAVAPGMLAQHYSPKTPLTLYKSLPPPARKQISECAAILLLRRPFGSSIDTGDKRLHWLSEKGELKEIAKNLFAILRALDSADWKHIHAEFPSGAEGLAPAIRDRLIRAASKHKVH